MQKPIRNLGIIAHIDAGKTTVTERILFVTGKKHKVGEVHDGEATMDFLDEEKRRGITISSAATTLSWRDHVLNLIDTPGHVDFTAEVERSLRVLDGAVAVVCGVAGVEAQTETVWRQADRHAVPRLVFVNKLDRAGASFDGAIASLRARLGAVPAVLQVPIGRERDFAGVVDVVTGRAFTWGCDARSMTTGAVPPELVDTVRERRHELLEAVADHSDVLFAKLVDGVEPSHDEIRAAIRLATLARAVVPVLGGAAFKEKGIQPLLDAVVDYLPAPTEVPQTRGNDPKTGAPLRLPPEPDAPASALVFKTVSEAEGDLSFVRVYSGTLRQKKKYLNPRVGRMEALSRLLRVHAQEREAVPEAVAGEIVAVAGLKLSVTGDTLCDYEPAIVYEAIRFPQTVVSVAVEPKRSADRKALLDAIQKLCKDDPTLQSTVDEQSGEILLNGMGSLHLEVASHRLETDFRIPLRLGRPHVTWQQTIRTARVVEVEAKKPGAAGATLAVLRVRFAPNPGVDAFAFADVPEERMPAKLCQAFADGLRTAVHSGSRFGFTIVRLRAELESCELCGDEPPSPSAFEAAAAHALREALEGNSTLLEPIVRSEVAVPSESTGPVIADLVARRGVIEDRRDDALGNADIEARVPLTEMLDYATALRSLTQGHGRFTMEPCGYDEAPPEVAGGLAGYL
jgi:elongation factor G